MDARVARTRSALQDSLLRLARERPLDDISVGDIATAAGLNRTTFYQHYSDKDTLLADALDAATGVAEASLPDLDHWPDAPPRALFVFLEHVEANPQVYRRALGRQGSALVMARLRDRIEAVAIGALTERQSTGYDGIPVDVVSAGLVGAALGVTGAWLEQEPRPSVDVAAEWMWRVLAGPRDAAFDGPPD